MTLLLRAELIVVSLLTFAAVIRKIRQSAMHIDEAVFWVLLTLLFLLFAVCPAVPDFLAGLLGIYSTANFLFLFVIFVLLVKVFQMSRKISELEQKLTVLVQEKALERKDSELS